MSTFITNDANSELSSAFPFSELPHQLGVNILSLLSFQDVLHFSCSSKAFRMLAISDEVWMALYSRRWPNDSSRSFLQPSDSFQKFKIRCALMKKQSQTALELLHLNSRHDSVEFTEYQQVINVLKHSNFQFSDVVEHLFKPDVSVLVNLIGLHYASRHLNVTLHSLLEAMECRFVHERDVCLRWWTLGGMSSIGYRMRDAIHTLTLPLHEIARMHSNSFLSVLNRGRVHEVLRIQISADFKSSAWVRC